MKRLNNKWGNAGHCIRLSQRKGDPEALSDLILGIDGDETYSIEVKRITNKSTCKSKKSKTRPLSFASDFSVTTSKIEHPHQLIRQTTYTKYMGWIPLVFLQVVTPSVGTDEYLFNSRDLYALMKSGEKSLKSENFPVYHDKKLYDYLFKVDKAD